MHREMRRKDKLIEDRTWIDEVLNEAETIFISMNGDDGYPYMLPASFGYDGECIYLHGAASGKKIDLLKRDARVCFHAHVNLGIVRAEEAANFTFKYKSVTGFGRVVAIEDPAEKVRGLNVLMDHYKGPHIDGGAEKLAVTWAAKIEIEHITGKVSPAPRKD